MSAVSATLAGRRAAESLMLDAGKALHPTGGWTVIDGVEVLATEPLFGTDAEPIRCKIQVRELVARESEVGGRTVITVRTELHLPASTPPMTTGDLWELVSVDALSLAAVGWRYRVVGPVGGTMKTARRYEVEREAN